LRRSRHQFLGLLLAALGVGAGASAQTPAVATTAAAGERFDAVVIDAGHGGDSHGAPGPDGLLEKDVVLAVAKRLAERLEAKGLRVVMTRNSDVAVALAERTRIANDAGADLFVSVHANAAPSRVARGMETFFLSLDASDEGAGRVAARENEAFGPGVSSAGASDDPVSAILGDLAHTEYLVESDEIARLAHARLAAIDPVPSRGVKQAPFVVLMGVRMPAVLVEIGFMTNPTEGQSLGTPARQAQIADAIADAVLEFGRRYDARRGAASAATGKAPESVAPAEAGKGGS
jgi:N-acetylmuramoyl-L-alanine amidase